MLEFIPTWTGGFSGSEHFVSRAAKSGIRLWACYSIMYTLALLISHAGKASHNHVISSYTKLSQRVGSFDFERIIIFLAGLAFIKYTRGISNTKEKQKSIFSLGYRQVPSPHHMCMCLRFARIHISYQSLMPPSQSLPSWSSR